MIEVREGQDKQTQTGEGNDLTDALFHNLGYGKLKAQKNKL